MIKISTTTNGKKKYVITAEVPNGAKFLTRKPVPVNPAPTKRKRGRKKGGKNSQTSVCF